MSHTIEPPPPPAESSTVADPDCDGRRALRGRRRRPFDKTTPEQENTFHHYTGNAIPWFVRGIWIAFWCYAITYFVIWLLPALQSELLSPP